MTAAVGVHATTESTPSDGGTVTTPSAGTSQASGSTFVICVFASGGVLSNFTDNKSNSYTQIFAQSDALDGRLMYLFYCKNGAGGAGHTFSVDVDSTQRVMLFGFELTGVDTTAPLDADTDYHLDNDGTPYTDGGITIAQANEILISFIVADTGGTTVTYTAGNSFTKFDAQTDNATYWPCAVGYRVVSSIAAYNASWTHDGSGGADTCNLILVGFKELASGTQVALTGQGATSGQGSIGNSHSISLRERLAQGDGIRRFWNLHRGLLLPEYAAE